MKIELESNGSALSEKRHGIVRQEVNVGMAQAMIGGGVRVIHVFAERGCSGYTFQMRVQPASYRVAQPRTR